MTFNCLQRGQDQEGKWSGKGHEPSPEAWAVSCYFTQHMGLKFLLTQGRFSKENEHNMKQGSLQQGLEGGNSHQDSLTFQASLRRARVPEVSLLLLSLETFSLKSFCSAHLQPQTGRTYNMVLMSFKNPAS